jgi:Ser-tRNA(Ala) deacylase AlaX
LAEGCVRCYMLLRGLKALTVSSLRRFARSSIIMAAVAMPTDASTSAEAALAARLDATPSHYAHVTFPLPDKRYVGMLHCQRDPLAATLVTRVVRCDKVQKSSTSGADKKSSKAKPKKGSAAPPTEQDVVGDEWQVELADTVLFPEGGGQPSDTGRIVPLLPDGQDSPSSASAAAVVRQVIRRNLDAVHFVSKPFEVGTQVRLEVDMDRRRDLMDQHTGQHVRPLPAQSTMGVFRQTPDTLRLWMPQLLSAVLEHEYQAGTLSWSLQKYPELNYVELPRNLTPEEIAAVQRRCNDLIDEARPIRVKFELANEETGVQLGEHVPSDYKAGEHGDERPPVQRTVIIDQLDENP